MKYLYSEISSSLPHKPLRRLFGLISGERKPILAIYLYAIVAGLIGLSLPLGVQAIINQVATGAITTSWFVLILLVTVGVLVGGIVQILQLAINETIQQRIFVKSALELSFRIPRLDSFTLRRHHVPELLNRFFDTVTVQKGLSKILLDFSASTLQIFFGLILLSFYHPFFILFGFGLVLILLGIIRWTGPIGLKTSLEESKFKYEVAHWLEEIGRKRDLFKGKFPSQFSLKTTDDLTYNYLNARKGHFRILVLKYIVLLLFKILIIGGLLIIGSLLVVENQLNLGQFVAAEIVIILIISSVEKLVLSVETIYDVLTGLEKLGYITDLPLEESHEVGEQEGEIPTAVEMKDFSLTFPESRESLVEHLNLSLNQGERMLITAGDSKAIQGLMRSISGDFSHYSGSLTINGIPIRNWDKDLLRENVGVFSNLDDIIDGSLLDNICLTSGSVKLSRVTEVANKLGLESYVDQLPKGWDSDAGPDGFWLPEHVKAKLILGRIILAESSLILLEGLFSKLHLETQQAFISCLIEELPNSTVICFDEASPSFFKFDKSLSMDGSHILPGNPAQA